jgi:hypothetical protein
MISMQAAGARTAVVKRNTIILRDPECLLRNIETRPDLRLAAARGRAAEVQAVRAAVRAGCGELDLRGPTTYGFPTLQSRARVRFRHASNTTVAGSERDYIDSACTHTVTTAPRPMLWSTERHLDVSRST